DENKNMRQLDTEEKAVLLLSSADDDDNPTTQTSLKVQHDNFPVVAKRPKTYQRRRTTNTHPMYFFIFILGSFIFGCLSGVAIMVYRMSQDAEQSSSFINSPHLKKVDLSIKTKLVQSITKANFVNLTRSIESENDAANRVEQNWQLSSKLFTRVNKFSYDVTLSKYVSSTQWSGIKLVNRKTDEEIIKFNLLTTDDYLTFSSLIKSGRIDANYIYYVNYGRHEDFAYLLKTNQIQLKNNDKTIIFMRRKSTIISQTEQIRQALAYGFAGLVLFDYDEINSQITTTNDRQSFAEKWNNDFSEKDRQQLLDGTSNEDDRQISVLILPFSDVEKIFTSETNVWSSCPSEWHNTTTSLKLGGLLQSSKLRFITFMEEVPVHLPVVLGYSRGTLDPDHFVMIGYQLGRKQQEKVVQEIIQAYENQFKNGWKPRCSLIFCAWSGLSYDQHTIRQWISANYRLIDRNLIAYIDLGNGIIGNSTINLHGSPLFQQVAQRAADTIVSPLVHDHTCHNRQSQMPMSNAHIHHRRRRRHGDEHGQHMQSNEHTEETACEPHKLLDEWMRASKNRIGLNKSLSIVQMIDTDSSASLFQLQRGIPSILIEMTDEQALTNDTFYLQKSPAVFNNEIQPEVVAAYTQFVSEIVRQLIDEPLIPFNLTDYANLIEKQTNDYIIHYEKEYQLLNAYLGDSNEMTKLISDLTKSIRQLQTRIDQASKNNYVDIQLLNEKLIQFERLFINDNSLRQINPMDKTYKHILFGPAFGLTNTIVPYPSLSNILFGISNYPKTELNDVSKLYWSKFRQHIQLITRTLNGFDGLLSNP
ncbi:unnamed protein product, partial [Adineta steineri]